MLNPFDLKAALMARHAQHVVLVHFPIALCITGAAFDLVARGTKREAFGTAAFFNLSVAAFATLPTLLTGLLAWQWQLEGQRLQGNLLLHLVFGTLSSALLWIAWWVRARRRRCGERPPGWAIAVELAAAACIGLTAHIGGFLSGVNL